VFPPLTYSRNWYGNLWNPGAVNTGTNTITLLTPWAGPSIPAGTQLSNGSSGGTYKYITALNVQIPNTWTTYTGIIEGIDTTGTNVTDKFAPGTASVKILFLNNRDVAGATVYYTNVQFGLDLAMILNQSASVQTASFNIAGTGRIQGNFTTAGSISAASLLARGTYLNQTLVATANNDVLVGLDIASTFTLGAFTGVSRFPLRIRNAGNTASVFGVSSDGVVRWGNTIESGNSTGQLSWDTDLVFINAALNLGFRTTGTDRMRIFSTGNIGIATTTDAGYRLDVVGTARISGAVTLTSSLTVTSAMAAGQSLAVGTFAPAVASAQMEIVSTTRGFLPPRMTNAQRLAIATPAVGLIVYCTDMVEGLYINKSTGWTFII
jgi:hypothetical protein